MATNFLKKFGEFTKKLTAPTVDVISTRHRSKNIIGFYSPAENSGTTSLLMNIAEILQSPASPVCVVDFNFSAPNVYRYLGMTEVPPEKSMSLKFRNTSMSPNELVIGDTNSLGVLTMSGIENPSDYCDIVLTVIDSTLRELAVHYKYVLVDLGTSLNDDQTIAGLLTCNKVYSVVRPISSQLIKLMSVQAQIENLNYVNKIQDVIQTMILDNPISSDDFAESGFNLIGNVTQNADLMIAADNCKYVNSALKGSAVKNYVKLIKSIASDITKIVENTTISSDPIDTESNNDEEEVLE